MHVNKNQEGTQGVMSTINSADVAARNKTPGDAAGFSNRPFQEERENNIEQKSDAGNPEKVTTAGGKSHGGSGVMAMLTKCVTVVIPPGGILASAFNLASSSIGAGILGLSLATNSSGLLMAILYLIVITYFTVYSMYALGVAAQRSKMRSLEGIAAALLGRPFAYVVACVRTFHSFSACVAYVISVGDIFKNIMSNSESAPEFLKSTTGNRLLTVLIWLCCMLPLVIPRHIDSLRYFSTFAVLFVVYFVMVIVWHSSTNGLPVNIHNVSVTNDGNSNVVLFNSGNKAIQGLGVFMFAYVCQINALEVYLDMSNPTLTRYTLASALGMVLCFLLYTATAFFGYLDFGSKVTKSILLMYNPIKNPAVMAAYVGVLSKLCASYAIIAMACRNALYHAVGWDADTLPFWKHCIAVICLSLIMLLCGLFIPKIQIVFGFAGSITGGSLGFIIPALLVMYSGNWTWQKVGTFNYICTYLLLLLGVIGIVFGTGATIYGTITG